MRELVAGPTTITAVDSDYSGFAPEANRGIWIDSLGALATVDSGEIFLVQTDGKALRIGHPSNRSFSGFGWAKDADQLALYYTLHWMLSSLPSIQEGTIHDGVSLQSFAVLSDRLIY